MLNTTYAFNQSVIFFLQGASLFLLMVMVLPLSFYMLLLLIDLHKQFLFTAGKIIQLVPFRTFDPSFNVLGWLYISYALVIHDNVSLVLN